MKGSTVKWIRKEHGFTQAQFATALGVSRSTIIRVEREQLKPSRALEQRIERLFDRNAIEQAQAIRAQSLAERMLQK